MKLPWKVLLVHRWVKVPENSSRKIASSLSSSFSCCVQWWGWFRSGRLVAPVVILNLRYSFCGCVDMGHFLTIRNKISLIACHRLYATLFIAPDDFDLVAVAFHCTHPHTQIHTYTPKRLLWLDIYFISINTDFLFFRTTTTTWLYFCRWQCEDDDDSLSAHTSLLLHTTDGTHIIIIIICWLYFWHTANSMMIVKKKEMGIN